MHLMYTMDDKGNRVYTLKKLTAAGKVAKSAHPGMSSRLYNGSAGPCFTLPWNTADPIARFSPDDKFSRHRVTIKRRFGILPTQLPTKPL